MQHLDVHSSANVIVHKSAPVKAPQSHDELLWMATTRFCSEKAYKRLTIDQYLEAFYLLIGTVKTETKQAIAALLADCPFAPRSVVIYLSLEELKIATPLLNRSSVLGQLDLLQLIQKREDTHSHIIASRPDLGPSVVQRMRALDDARVQKALDDNYALVENAPIRSADALFENLRKRHEDVDAKMRHLEHEAEAPKKNEEQGTISPSQRLIAAAARGGRMPAPVESEEKSFDSLVLSSFDFGKALEKAARARCHQTLAVLMQKQAGIALDTAYQVLDDKSGDTFSVLMRAHQVENARAHRILLLTQPSIGLSIENSTHAVRFYSQLNPKSCLEAIAQWPQSTQSKPQHQPYMQETKPVRRSAQVISRAVVSSVQWASEKQSA